MAGLSIEVRGDRELKEQLDAFPDELRKSRASALRSGAQIIVKHWRLRLSGPAGPRRLGIGTGHLRRSILAGHVEGDTVRVGTNQPYAAVHEYGFHGRVNVRAHTREGVPVRAHTRQMMMPERPHARPAMRDASEPIRLLFAGKVDEAIARSKAIGERTKATQRAAGFGPGSRRTR
jgi:phage gpG-like protein